MQKVLDIWVCAAWLNLRGLLGGGGVWAPLCVIQVDKVLNGAPIHNPRLMLGPF